MSSHAESTSGMTVTTHMHTHTVTCLTRALHYHHHTGLSTAGAGPAGAGSQRLAEVEGERKVLHGDSEALVDACSHCDTGAAQSD